MRQQISSIMLRNSDAAFHKLRLGSAMQNVHSMQKKQRNYSEMRPLVATSGFNQSELEM